MEVQAQSPAIGWGRASDGRFVIGVNQGGTMLYAFILDAREEQELRAALVGVILPATPDGPATLGSIPRS